ncbi:MAG: hypothetical protein O2897_05460, partial [bacterium]|nr:hypothetical protein [bacterium]
QKNLVGIRQQSICAKSRYARRVAGERINYTVLRGCIFELLCVIMSAGFVCVSEVIIALLYCLLG